MWQARARYDWDQTSQVLAMLYNAHRPSGAAVLRPADFHPLPRPEPTRPAAAKVKGARLLKSLFVDRQPPSLR